MWEQSPSASLNLFFEPIPQLPRAKRWIRERVGRGELTSKKVGLWTRGEVRIAPFKCYAAPPIVPSTPKRQKQRPPEAASDDARPKEGQRRKAFKIEEADFEALLARFSSDESLQGAGIKSRGICGGIVAARGPLTRDGIRCVGRLRLGIIHLTCAMLLVTFENSRCSVS